MNKCLRGKRQKIINNKLKRKKDVVFMRLGAAETKSPLARIYYRN